MVADQWDIVGRLRSLISASWYPFSAMPITGVPSGDPITSLEDGEAITSSYSGPPVLNAVLQAPSTMLAFIYGLLAFVQLQTRIRTSTGGWLDLTAYDFFAGRFTRASGQSDASFSAAIIQQLFLLRNTRQAITDALVTLTGHAPVIFEPWRIPDTGCLGKTFYWSVSPLGSRTYGFAVFITAYRGNGASDAAIYAAVESVRAAGVKTWVLIKTP